MCCIWAAEAGNITPMRVNALPVQTPWLCTLGPAYNEFGYSEHPPRTGRFLCISITDCNVKKLAYNDYPLITSSFFCIILHVVSWTWCICHTMRWLKVVSGRCRFIVVVVVTSNPQLSGVTRLVGFIIKFKCIIPNYHMFHYHYSAQRIVCMIIISHH